MLDRVTRRRSFHACLAALACLAVLNLEPASASAQRAPQTMRVYVLGAVRTPGALNVPTDARVDDAFAAALGSSRDKKDLRVTIERIVDRVKTRIRAKWEDPLIAGDTLVVVVQEQPREVQKK